jgi:hypothetical protein
VNPRRLFAPAFAALLLIGATHAGTPRRPQEEPESRRSEILAPGIEHIEIRRGDFSAGRETNRWVINILTLDPRRARIVSALAMDEVVGAEMTSSIAGRHGALAAVNGGYFQTAGIVRGEPTGIYVLGDKVLSEPSRPRTELAITNAGGVAKLTIAQVDVEPAVVASNHESHPVNGINRARGEDELIVFTPEFHRTTLTSPGGIEISVRNGRVAAVAEDAGSQPIPADGYILSASGKARAWAVAYLRPDVRVALDEKLVSSPPLPFQAEAILGGGPHLLKDGRTLGAAEADTEGFSGPDFTFKRHPRTATGTRPDGTIILVTVDGRQPKISVGMTVEELAALMLELGCVDAINLDGGGSTTMVVRGRVVNSPSDAAGERPVSDALLVFERK